MTKIENLHARGDGILSRRNSILARVSPNTAGAEIYLHRDTGRNLIAEISAQARREASTTVIEGVASIGHVTWYLPMLVVPLLLIGFATFASMAELPPLSYLGLIGAAAAWPLLLSVASSNRTGLVEELATAVGA